MRTSGSAKVTGDVEAGEFHTSGSGKVAGRVQAERVRISGSQSIGGDLKGKEVRVSGACSVGGDVEAEFFKASGSFEIAGLLNAEQVEIHLAGRSRVREIGGTRVTVRIGGSGRTVLGIPLLLRLGRWTGHGDLEVETIEADEIELEATKARVVRGQRVRIGPGCEIETVEYGESLEVEESAFVARKVRIGEACAGATPASVPRAEQPADRPRRPDRKKRGRWTVVWNGREVTNPVARAVIGALGGLFGCGAAAIVTLSVLALVGVVITSTLAFVVALLAALAVGIPLLVLGSPLIGLILAPVVALRKYLRRRRLRKRHKAV